MKHLHIHFVLFCALLTLGCNDGKVGLGGKVTFDDGSPVTQGTVNFETPDYVARGTIKPDGTYTVGSVKENDGLPPGDYKVSLSDTSLEGAVGKSGLPTFTNPVASKYSSAATSGLSFKVDGSQDEYNITVERAQK